ncbi:lipoprotein [Labrenzia sp. 011]|uniref:LPS translocon maturation chaperone LptM n=1 Tax=Labrenzia sp. 011 TaxID=2171494 RepID=UPI00197C6CDA|nr:lipoprotein [Labrenzia sp. 011]
MNSRLKVLALLGLCLGLTLAGCGRKGSLDNPGSPEPPQGTAADPAASAVPPQEPQSDQSFFLDFLIN